MQLYPVELQRSCCVQIIKLCLGRRQTAEQDDDDCGDSGSGYGEGRKGVRSLEKAEKGRGKMEDLM